MEIIDGVIQDYNERGIVTVTADYADTAKFARCGYKQARIILMDNRRISNEQRKKIYAMINEMADWMGEVPETTKDIMKVQAKQTVFKDMMEDFSLSDCSVTLASDFINLLINYILAWNVPLKQPLKLYSDDITKYVYACLKNKRCCECGRKAVVHHVDTVGMGNDRKAIGHLGLRALSLCPKHHSEIHNIGDKKFLELYHLEPVKLDKTLCKIYKLKE